MKIIDISWPVKEGIIEYGGRTILEFSDHGNESIVTLVNHTGTHVDGPRYFFKDAKTIDQFDLNKLIGECQVLDLTSIQEKITQKDLEKFDIKENQIILFKTKNSSLSNTGKWQNDFIYLDESGAEYLVNKKVKSIGTDYVALESRVGFPSHKILLKNEILIIEGLRLKDVEPKQYQLFCLPVKLIGLDAAFARAILIED